VIEARDSQHVQEVMKTLQNAGFKVHAGADV
jgi:hypothetical protein